MSLVALLLAGAVLGTVIGMLGGGGGVLAVPMLVALGEPVLSASTMSLVVVGTGAAAALVPHQRARRVDWRTGLIFGALGSVGAVVGARVSGLIPDHVLLLGFSVLVLLGAGTMLRAGRTARALDGLRAEAGLQDSELLARHRAVAGVPDPDVDRAPVASAAVRVDLRVVVLASGVGLVTGLFGVGAGFVVVPALVAALHVPIKRATATALVVIVINSLVALAARHEHLRDLGSALQLAAVTAVFAVIGAVLSRRVPSWVLSSAFGTLLVLVAVYTIARALTL
ncbi:MAG TPA: sulfite exporter TauE/SafE family protein [Candidatus Nanopelagicales bacterium]|nr:sulfite exporter TauE/SafE family protein [Candidatus Nanopelagicales bacterium]